MKKSSYLRPWAVWSTAALTALTLSLSPVGTYAAQAATVEVKGTTGAVQPAPTTPARNTTIPAVPESSKQSSLPNVLVIGTGGRLQDNPKTPPASKTTRQAHCLLRTWSKICRTSKKLQTSAHCSSATPVQAPTRWLTSTTCLKQ